MSQLLTSSADHLLADLVEELTQKLAAGDSAVVEAFLAGHPDQADKLRQLIPTLQMLAEIGSSPATLGRSRASLAESNGHESGGQPVLGDFRILREVGRGGMGVVYEAEQISLRRCVALKVLPSAAMLDPRALQRFRNEAQAAAALHHSQIVPIYGVGCERGVHYYAMQFIDGLTLAEVIASLRQSAGLPLSPWERDGVRVPDQPDAPHQPEASARDIPLTTDSPEHGAEPARLTQAPRPAPSLTPAPRPAVTETDVLSALSTEKSRTSPARFRRIAEQFAQVAEALHHAHELGVTHRDIKPANLMLDRLGHIWITDFGLARIEGEGNLTMTGDLVGTLRYMSPEQALAKRIGIDHRTDIYSLGITLYELLTLHPALPGPGRPELLRQIASEEPKPPRKHNRAIPRDLETILLKMIEKIPAERYQTAQDLAADLKRFAEDKHIEARRPTLQQQAARWCRRHRTVVTTSASILIAALIFAAGSAWWIALERSQQQQEKLAAVSLALDEVKAEKAKVESAVTRERRANEQVQSQLKQIERGNELLAAIFLDLDIREIQRNGDSLASELAKRIVTSSELLDDASISDPLVLAQMQYQLGRALQNLGHPAKAIELCEKAHLALKELLGADAPTSVASTNVLAMSYIGAGQSNRALPLLEDTFEVLKNGREGSKAYLSETVDALAIAYRVTGTPEKAVALLEESLVHRRRALGTDHTRTNAAMNNLGVAYRYTHQDDKALQLWEEALESLQGSNSRNRLKVILNLTTAYLHFQQYDKAQILLEETLPLFDSTLGVEHPDSLGARSNLASAYLNLGQADLGIPILSAVLKARQAHQGPHHRDTLLALNNLAGAYQNSQQVENALPLYEEALPLFKAHVGQDDLETLLVMQNLYNAYKATGQLDRAVKIGSELLRIRRQKLGSDHADTLYSTQSLGNTYWAAGAFDDALALLQDALPVMEAKLGSDNALVLKCKRDIARSFASVKRVEEAIGLMETVLDVQTQKLGDSHRDALDSMHGIAVIYSEAGLGEKAEEWFAKYIEGRRRSAMPNDLGFAAACTGAARYLLRCKRFEAAEHYERECLAIGEQVMPDHWATFNAKSQLGGALLGQKRYEEAERPLLEGYRGMKKCKESIPLGERARLVEGALRLVQLYSETSESEEAKKWEAEKALYQAPAATTPAVESSAP